MTNVVFKREKDKLISFSIDGHTGYADEGEDIVCSAITAISNCIGDGILEVLKIKANYEIRDGFFSLSLKGLPLEEIVSCQVLMETLLLGLKNIENMYSDYIKVKMEEV